MQSTPFRTLLVLIFYLSALLLALSALSNAQTTPPPTNPTPVIQLPEAFAVATAAGQAELSAGSTLSVTWSFRNAALVDAEEIVSIVLRNYITAQSRCPSTLDEKSAGYTQIIVPAVKLKSLLTKITFDQTYYKKFCLYFQKAMDPANEFIISPTSIIQGSPDAYEMRIAFCDSCSSASLGCDFLDRKCICPIVNGPYVDDQCNTKETISDRFSNNPNQCVWKNTDTGASTITSCACSNFWMGSTCNRCSLDDCTGWNRSGEKCFVCAPARGTDAAIVSNSDCSRCTCTNAYYRGHTCYCRSAIFAINGHFAYPKGNVTSIDLKYRYTAEYIAPELAQMIHAKLHLLQLRLALAYDLNLPMYNIEIVHYHRDNIRVAVSPWCLPQFYPISQPTRLDPNRAETRGVASASMILEPQTLSSEEKELLSTASLDPEHLAAVEKINQLKVLYTKRWGRSPEELTEEARKNALGPLGQYAKFQTTDFTTLHNLDNAPFFDLFDRVQKLVDNSGTTYTKSLLDTSSTAGNSDFAAQQVYFPGCTAPTDTTEDPYCENLGPNYYAPKPSDDSLMIIIIVIVVVVVLLAIAVGSCLYCHSKKICCFKAIAEYNERKKRREAERAERASGTGRDGSGSTASGSASGDKSGDGSNSSHPKSDSASGGTLTGAVYHGSSGSGVTADNRGSGSGSASSGYPMRPSGSNGSGSRPPAVARRTSHGGRPADVGGSPMGTPTSPRDPNRRQSRGGRQSRHPSRMEGSRVGGLRASRVQPSTPAGAIEEDGGSDDLPLPVGWERAVAQDGKTYYVNTETLTSQWTHPALPSQEKERSLDDLDEFGPE